MEKITNRGTGEHEYTHRHENRVHNA